MMRISNHFRRAHRRSAGFTLPTVLVVVGALLILVVGLLFIVGIERSTARSYVDMQRAELAAKAGLEDIRGVLNREAANDDFLIIQSYPAGVISEREEDKDRRLSPFLFLSRGSSSGSSYKYRHIPLFSTKSKPGETALVPPVIGSLFGKSSSDRTTFETLPYQDKVMAAWLPVTDPKSGKIVARYAYWVEDLEGKIDPASSGNTSGSGNSFARVAYPFPAPGLNPTPQLTNVFRRYSSDQIASYALDPLATEAQQGNTGKNLFNNRSWLVSPDSTLAAAGFSPPLQRLEQKESPDPVNPAVFGRPGELADKTMRALEESAAPGLRGYEEQALVPFADGIDPSVAGQPKLNLNRLLATGGDSAVSEMANFIRKALPKFEQRKGGFPDDYVKTLAANALDYADSDSDPTISSGSYRGLDAYPLVSEFLMRFSWDNANNGDITLSVSTYAELWNMTDQPVSGDFQLSYETGYSFKVGLDPEGTSLSDLSKATPKLESADGYNWFPKINVTLKPNEYRVFRCGTLTYRWNFGTFVPSPITLSGDFHGRSKSGYHMKWNNVLVDQARGNVHRNDCSLYYKVSGKSPLAVRCTIPGHSYSTAQQVFTNNMGDPRMAFYLGAPQDANAYPINYSPNRRTIRWGSIYGNISGARDQNQPTKPSVFGRVMPSEWPDGGHNSVYGSNSFYSTDDSLLPDDPRFMNNPPVPVKEEAPTRLSNRGRFYSATELGRVYDPIMWEVALPNGPNLPWGDVTANAKDSTRGGGNTLRIGRPEHQYFNRPGDSGWEAYHLLDLFHAGISCSDDKSEREGNLIEVVGKVNLNTASRDVLRALAIGAIRMDPLICKRTSENHELSTLMAPPTASYKPTEAEIVEEANRIADAIIALRAVSPFATPGAISEATATTKASPIKVEQVIGNKRMVADGNKIHRTDSAAEEVFARMYEAGTVRSRNFRIWVVGQSLAPTTESNTDPEVLAEVRKAYTVFADPGERDADGAIDRTKTKLTILHENNF